MLLITRERYRYSIPEELLRRSGLETRRIDARAGDLLLIHVLVVHKAGNNASAVGRHAVINEYKATAAVDLWGNSCGLAGLPLLRQGQEVLPRVAAKL